MRADYQGVQLWWWRNPGGRYAPDVSWERYTIKKGGARQHHDQTYPIVRLVFATIPQPQFRCLNIVAESVRLAVSEALDQVLRNVARLGVIFRY